jgi:hypothetical protein
MTRRKQEVWLQVTAGQGPSECAWAVVKVLEQIDPYIYHCMGIDVRHFVEAHRSEEAERSLLLLYENGPCSLCRHGAVEELIAIDRLPAWIREECQYDAYSETRKLVASKA